MKFTWSSSYIVSAELGVLQSHSPVWLSRLLRASLFQTSSWTWTCYLRTCIHVWQNWGSDSSSEGPNRRKGLSVPTPLFNPWVHQLETQLDFKTAFIQHSSFCTAFVHKLWRNGMCRCCDPVGTLTINMGGLKKQLYGKNVGKRRFRADASESDAAGLHGRFTAATDTQTGANWSAVAAVAQRQVMPKALLFITIIISCNSSSIRMLKQMTPTGIDGNCDSVHKTSLNHTHNAGTAPWRLPKSTAARTVHEQT